MGTDRSEDVVDEGLANAFSAGLWSDGEELQGPGTVALLGDVLAIA